jgi:hypothetical protein
MFTAKKLVAACLRLLAFGNAIYLVVTLVSAVSIIGGLSARILPIVLVWGALTVLLFIYAIPLARFIATGIDES